MLQVRAAVDASSSTVAPASKPVSASVPILVMWSLPEEPVSLVSATPGAAGAGVEGEGEGGVVGVAGHVGGPHDDVVERPPPALKLLVKVVPPSML